MKHWLALSLALVLVTAATATADSNKPDKWALAGFSESETPANKLPGYRPLKRVLVALAPPELLQKMQAVLPGVELVSDANFDSESVATFDAVLLSCARPDLMARAQGAAWVHAYSAGLEKCLEHPVITQSEKPIIFTNSRGSAAAVIAEHALAMTMSMARGLHHFRDKQQEGDWSHDVNSDSQVTTTIGGKTMLVLGLGSIGREVALRANALGMRVIATRNRSREGPSYVDYVGLADETLKLATEADVVVNALPLTSSTRGLIDEKFFAAMKSTALLVSVGRGGTTDTEALLKALRSNSIAGAALDVTDPEPLPNNHPLWKEPNVIITPHLAGSGGDAFSKTFSLAVENLRRYQAGEPLLNLVDARLGY